jgi:hypothetical protein
VLDRELQPVPIGVAGELFLAGTGLARGYLHRPDLTAERFVPDPFVSVRNARMYKTGDLVRYLTDGRLEYVGRLDHQVKIRGFRIELGEIETVLSQQPGVMQCVVVARENLSSEKRLVAYLRCDSTTENPLEVTTRLKAELKKRLPDYMVPPFFVFLQSFPMTPNGKIDRNALPEPESNPTESLFDYVAPRTPVEEKLAGIWADVLGLPRVGIHDNFFQLGGHSLLALRTVSRTQQLLDVDLPLAALFENPTVATLAVRVVEEQMALFEGNELADLLDEIESYSEIEDAMGGKKPLLDGFQP